jgi:hypothetical protein
MRLEIIMRNISTPLIITALLGLSACSASDTASTPSPLTEKQAKQVEELLGGKVAGKPQQCLDSFRNSNAIRLSDDFLIYRVNRNLVYRNELRSSCPGLARDDDIMVIRSFSTSHCRGDQFQLVDRSSGIPGPTCVFGEFVPYKSADKAG